MLLPATLDLLFNWLNITRSFHIYIIDCGCFCTVKHVNVFLSMSFPFGVNHLIAFEANRIILSHVVDSARWHSFLSRSTIYLLRHWQLDLIAIQTIFPAIEFTREKCLNFFLRDRIVILELFPSIVNLFIELAPNLKHVRKNLSNLNKKQNIE